jgi:transcriptional regulator with XRE-family HTH domain
MNPISARQRDAIHRRLTQVSAGFGGPATLAKQLGASDMSVRHWLSGRNLPSAELLIQLADLGVSPDWILFGEGRTPKMPYGKTNPATTQRNHK